MIHGQKNIKPVLYFYKNGLFKNLVAAKLFKKISTFRGNRIARCSLFWL